ncbi:DUF443 domain-containing protein [Halalkalibacterium halodurans]|uniref:BH0979 protein n=2 Tax=Halalkalibacterium halodurans TaxID=86665 RepID=Q9KE77_HALH5|nr:DUF443 domain-containing protein [Halalkalibacterium halodurans]MED4082028.1 DUF443 domain-containing protein [Halalkalibacterium halodurans]MED4085545.1 DUF443 domain-containing protein [Halalkalibacterium halodurans]MED4103407.1 DUF443 domain-containing protein [Halalkalibacterium halodurans]MED4110129.1 DUF443 domain-containing protein [Halalkalibacterium halodurans]MED4124187.1 DUF443 domain-containing protein [Halalkalibacterium halodurans]
MKCEVQKAMNVRFRILKIEGDTYILDMSQSIWKIVFPFLTWIIPLTIYKVDGEEINKKLQFSTKDQKKNNISILLTAGIGIALGNLLTALTDYFYIQSTVLVNSIIAGIVMGIIIVVRFVLSNRNKNNFYQRVAPNVLSKERIWIRPKSFKHFIQALFGYIFFLVFFIAAIVLFITGGNVIAIVSATIFALALSVIDVLYVVEGPTTVKFKKK